MGKISGKYAQFWYGGREYEFVSAEHSAQYSKIDVTDSSTPDQGMDSILGWAEASLKVDALIASALGTEIVTGTLVAGTRYLVTGGTITETQGTFDTGRLFESDGTGTASATNKVKELGEKLKGKYISCTIGGSDFPVVAMSFSEKYGEYDSTDSSTTGDNKEYIAGRAERTTTVEAIMDSATADKLTTSPAAQAVVLTFGTGDAITGTGIILSKSAPIAVAGDFVKISYQIDWQGVPTNTMENVLPRGVSTAAKMIAYPGTSTNKEYTGNAMVMSMDITTDMDSPVRVSYGLKWVGAVTEAVAN